MTSKIDGAERKQAAATAASFKFDMIDAMMVDDRLHPSDFKVGVALLQFQNSQTGELYPSQAALAETTGIAERTIRACLTKLRETGWLRWDRGNRQKANDYAFDDSNVAPMQNKRRQIEQARRRRKSEARGSSDRQSTATREVGFASLTGSPLPVPTGSPVPPNTLKGTPFKEATDEAA